MKKDKKLKKIIFQYCFVAIFLFFYILVINLSDIQGLPGFVNPLFATMDIHPINMYITLPLLLFAVFILLFNKMSNINKHTFFVLLFFVFFAFLFSISVAMIDGGPAKLWQPFTRTTLEYYGDIGKVRNPLVFLRDYISLMPSISEHAKSRPPGPILFLWFGSKLFGDGLLKSALWVIFIGSLSSIPLYLLAKEVCNEKVAIYSMALYALAPNIVLFTATSMTMVNAFFILVSIYLFLKAMNTKGLIYSFLSGISLSISFFMTFFEHGVIGIFFIIITIYYFKIKGTLADYLLKVATVAATFSGIYILLYFFTGFNLIACVITAYNLLRQQMDESPGQSFYLYWFLGKPVAFFLFVGIPITTLFLKELFKIIKFFIKKLSIDNLRIFDVFVITSLLILFVSDLPALKGEVERTWLSLVPFVVIPAGKNLSDFIHSAKSPEILYFTLSFLFTQTIVFESIFYTSW